MWIGHHKERWPILIINPVDKSKLSCYTSNRLSATVSLETHPSIHFLTVFLAVISLARGHKCNIGNGGLEYESLYGDQQSDINLIKFIHCKGNLPNKDSWTLNSVIFSHQN